MWVTRVLFTLLLPLLLVAVTGTTRAETRTFNHPTVKGIRLDWCKHWARQCGQPAADLFCQQQGFQRAQRFAIDPAIGARTLVFGDGRLCQNPACSGFSAIICTKPDRKPPTKMIVPRQPLNTQKKPPKKMIIPKLLLTPDKKRPGKLTLPKKPKQKPGRLTIPCLAKPESCCPDRQKTTACRKLVQALLDIRIRSYVPPRFMVMGDHHPLDVNITFDTHVADITKSKYGISPGCRFNPDRIKNLIRRNKSLWQQFVELGTAWLDQWSSAYSSAKTFVATNVAKSVCAAVDNSSSCRSKVGTAVLGAINAGLASLGIPPELPDIHQLREEGLKYLAAQAASQVVGQAGQLIQGIPVDGSLREKLYEKAYDATYNSLKSELDKVVPAVNVKNDNPFTWGHVDPAYVPRNARLYIEVRVRRGRHGAYERFRARTSPKMKWPKLYLHDTKDLYADAGPITIPKFIPKSGFVIPLELRPQPGTGGNAGAQIPDTVVSAAFLRKFGVSHLVRQQLNYQGWRGAVKFASDYDLFYSTGFGGYAFNLISGYPDGPLYWEKGLSHPPGAVYDAITGLGVRTTHYKENATLKRYFGLLEPARRCDGRPTWVSYK